MEFRRTHINKIMKNFQFPLITEIDNLETLPLETLVKLKTLYEDNNLPVNIKVLLEKEGFDSEKLSQLIAFHNSSLTPSQLEKIYSDKTFIHPEEKMANGMPIYTGYKAMLEKDTWTEETIASLACYRYEGKSNSENYIEHYINKANTKEIITLPFTEAIQIIDKYGIDTAKLHLILAVHACRQDEPWKAIFTLKGTDLIQALGWHKRTDLTLSEKLKKISQLAWAINCLLIKCEWILGPPKNNKVPVKISTSRMWDLAIEELGQKNSLTKKVDNPEEVEITVRPGLWTYFFLNDGGRAALTALYHFSWLSECIMSIDPYHEEAALRIAMIQSIAAYRNSFITVETWLKENLTGAATRIKKAKEDYRRRAELKSYWDNILITLRNVGFSVKFDPETYPEWLQPDSTEKNQRGYFETLLQARVSISPPTPAYLEQQKTNPKPIKKAITGTNIKKARESANLSLKIVADYFGKSRMWLSNKESGNRNLTQSEAKEILKAISLLQEKSDCKQ
jgi:DNA-binding transcriptional regulator YiaG